MRQFTPRQPPADIRVKPQEYKSHPEVSLSHDDLYARAWEYDFEQPIFDAENNSAATPSSQEILTQSDFSTEEMRNTPGATHECSPEIFPHTDKVSDVTDTYPHMEPDQARNNQKIVQPTPAVPNTTYVITQSLTAMTTTDISSSVELVCSMERARRRSRNSRNALRGTYVATQIYSGYSLATNSPTTQS